jgi:hypothetical protein
MRKYITILFIALSASVFGQTKIKTSQIDTASGTGVLPKANLFPLGDTRYVKQGGALGTPLSGTLTNATGLPLTTGVTGLLPVANGGTGTSTPAIVAGSGISVSGSWPNQTVTASGGGGVTTVTSLGTHENASISGSTLNIPNLWPRVWEPLGTVMTPDLVADAGNIQEPCVIYEGSPQVITDATGSVYKMLFTAGGSTQNIMYAESTDGNDWVRRTTVCIANHARGYLLKISTTYYFFCVPTTGGSAFGQVDVYSSTDMINWTLAAANIISKGVGGTWNGSSLANMAVYFDGTTYHMLLSGTNGGGAPFTTGYYSSTSITSGWTAYGSNPVMGVMNSSEKAPGYLTKIGSTFYAWVFGYSTNALLPTDIYRYHSSNMTTWVADNSGAATYPRSQSDEGAGRSNGQVANPCLVEVSGITHMFYEAGGDGSGTGVGAHLKHAVANYTIANLINTNEGNGAALNPSQVFASYTKTASDLNYIPNLLNMQTIGYTVGGIQLEIPATLQYGIRSRYAATPTTYQVLLPDYLSFLKTGGVTNTINTSSSGFNFQSWGGITFSNVSGSGSASLGNFDNTGLFTTTNGVTTNASGFNFASTAFGASETNGITLRNQTAATSGVTSRWSPMLYQNGTAWTGSASQLIQFQSYLIPISGTNPVTYNYVWKHNINGTIATVMQLASNGTLTTNAYAMNGSSSGTISILPQSAAGTYNFNLPTTAGTAGQLLTSQGGSSTAMTWSANTLPIHGNSTTTGTATTVVTVTIGQTMANTNYDAGIDPQDLLTAVNWYVSAKTTTTFDITFVTALTGSINFDWHVIP